MLILTRRPGQSIIIGEKEINILILGVSGNVVRIGIDAPLDITVHREEIYEKIQEERRKNLDNRDEFIDVEDDVGN